MTREGLGRKSPVDIDGLVRDDPAGHTFRVHRSAMTSQELFDLEIERVFNHSWLYVGHGSEIPEPGSFVRRSVGTRPVIFVRGRDGQVRVFFNTCPHRGATICRQDQGKATTFQCFYHAWTFNTEGVFVSGPDLAGYGPNWRREEMNLPAPAKVGEYRGFFFVAFDPGIESLEEYLGPAREYLDLIVDQSPAGMRVVAGSQQYTIRGNWKLLVENSIDGYHAAPVHTTYFAYVAQLARQVKTQTTGNSRAAGTNNKFGFSRSLGKGHASMEVRQSYGRPVARWSALFGIDAKERLERRRQELVERHGPVKAYRIADVTTNVIVYPNLVINDGVAVTIRKIDPVAPDELAATAWALAPIDEDADMLRRRLDSFLTFYGPGGFATPDDVEALESCQAGFRAGSPEWSDISRGMDRSPTYLDEAGIRGFWRRWYAQMRQAPVENEAEGMLEVDWDKTMREWEGIDAGEGDRIAA